jgi:hypothetical protein
MQCGFCIGINRDTKRIIKSKTEDLMEDFMQRNNIEDSQDVIVLPPTANKDYQERFFKALVDCLLIYIHGSNDPRICSAARNTSLFEMKGPAMGDISGTLNMSLMKFVARLKPGLLPDLPEQPKKAECAQCNRSLPEPDGFPGVTCSDDKLRCFSCYLIYDKTKKIYPSVQPNPLKENK